MSVSNFFEVSTAASSRSGASTRGGVHMGLS